ncbi:Rieske (2Fe-2S) protein [Pyrobaculum aerophilum]|uniref:(2Fe-2S)-binding protein n=1 Tax=Pyrobaculum aerophilum TaxID=13773 RepID=A0A371R284_9CREN|nr:nitrite reductase (NAD(P)H) small subunit [Pyrobaculum aerophilum]RFA97597.1 (2Fe-2S)-binding protein [Pyrobaculum aerophilum]RFA99353.1 (2Fe-2S)-binding protein [Pyrobaculum aerophilum]
MVPVCRVEELPEGRPVIKLVGQRPVALLKIAGRIYAFDAFCPHSRWNLGASGRVITSNGNIYIFCAGHAGMWCLKTGLGKVQGKEAPKLNRYEVRVVEGRVYVDFSRPVDQPYSGASVLEVKL